MKKILFLIPVLAAAAFIIGCDNATEKKLDNATLSFTNSSNSDGAINDIIWADGDQSWSTANGYDLGNKTEDKKVVTAKGSVSCTVSNGSSFVDAAVDFSGTGSALALSEGANTYTLKATVGSASVKK